MYFQDAGFDEMLTEARLEMDATRKLYSGTKLLGFAPNGNKSNLTDDQWVIVRTPAFKKWFGNWEAKERWKIVEAIEPLVIPLEQVDDESAKDTYGVNRKSDPNKYDGIEASFVANALQKVQGHKNADLINRCIPFINDLFMGSVPIYVERERNPRKSTNVVGFHNYLTKITYDNAIYYVRFTVQELTPTHAQKGGKGRTELHNVAISNIEVYSQTDINEARTLAVSSGLDSGDTKPTNFVDKNIANWLKDVKSSTSQVVDENGEPLIVHRGDMPDKSSFAAAQGNYFVSNKDIAKGYAGSYGNVYPVFLNIRNPFVFNEKNVSELKKILRDKVLDWLDMDNSELAHDDDFQRLRKVYEAFRNEGGSSVRDFYNGFLPEITEDMSDEAAMEVMDESLRDFYTFEYRQLDYREIDILNPFLKTLGYDGVVRAYDALAGYGETEYITFDPRQAKSVDNVGTFDGSNPNIYHQSVQAQGN